ncbi:Sphingomyelin phosphodiesterase [Eumeta japonica]|uniref:Sphingomyelin phosphodiesterase n=1 Tax=Eumeta variegata TaxID=151549 RepID=A0A4C1XC75_EUMVA|nr:Sphingomyelin phosphodiesterase [Eumeta japonica]
MPRTNLSPKPSRKRQTWCKEQKSKTVEAVLPQDILAIPKAKTKSSKREGKRQKQIKFKKPNVDEDGAVDEDGDVDEDRAIDEEEAGFAPSTVTEPGLDTHWLYEALVNKWNYYLDDDARQSLRILGGFSKLVKPGLRVISLNNNVAYKYNWWLAYDPLDAKRHLDWLIEELYNAEAVGEKVHIIAHIPPGVPDLTKTWSREYNRIVNRFTSTIAAEFNGHTHSDEFKIFYSSVDGSPINVAWNSGGATAYSHYNLNYKVVTVDTITYEPMDIENYIYNLTEANFTPERRPHWFRLYDFRTTFGINNLSAASMDDLVLRMVTSNRNLLELYSAFFPKLSDRRWFSCNDYCKLDQICKIVVTELWERGKCEELTSLFF